MDSTILQIPISKSLRNEAGLAASNMGFSSLQEAVRVFLTQLRTQIVKISFEQPPVQLSAKAIKRYDKIIDEIDSGKTKLKSFDSTDKMFEYLHR
jgi:antitoxin component of RelBE/YafQ-DinJ toxin-antitoxin module